MSTYVFLCTSKDDLTAEPAVQLRTVSAAAESATHRGNIPVPQYEDFIPQFTSCSVPLRSVLTVITAQPPCSRKTEENAAFRRVS